MADEFGLLPDVPPRPPGRYAPGTRPAKSKPWAPTEDLALWPPLLACESERTYLRTCVRLCEILGRVPGLSGPHPTAGAIVHESVALIERRTVTGVIDGRCREVLALAYRLKPNARTGRPLSWAEKARFLRPYYAKTDSRIARSDLMRLLQRSVHYDEDIRMIDAYLQSLAERPGPTDDEDLSVPCKFDRPYWQRYATRDVPASLYDEKPIKIETVEPAAFVRELAEIDHGATDRDREQFGPAVRAAYGRLSEFCLA